MCWTTLLLRALPCLLFLLFGEPSFVSLFAGFAMASQIGPWRSARRMCRGKKIPLLRRIQSCSLASRGVLNWNAALRSCCLSVCWTVSARPGKIRRHMATLIALGRVFVCALFSSKQSCESAGSLGKVNLAVADGSELITAEELRAASTKGGLGCISRFWKQFFLRGTATRESKHGRVACLVDSNSV